MRILSWMQGKKANGRKESKRTSNSTKDEMVHRTLPEEFSSWPHVLLAIGTFGDENLNQARPKSSQENPSSSLQHVQDLTPEELNILHKEFNLLLDEHLKQSGPSLEFEVSQHCPSNMLLTRSFESETTKNEPFYDELIKKSDSFQHVILSKSKDAGTGAHDTTVIGKRTLSFLLKKIFVCGGGIAPATVAPPPRIITLESKMEKSNIDKTVSESDVEDNTPKEDIPSKLQCQNIIYEKVPLFHGSEVVQNLDILHSRRNLEQRTSLQSSLK